MPYSKVINHAIIDHVGYLITLEIQQPIVKQILVYATYNVEYINIEYVKSIIIKQCIDLDCDNIADIQEYLDKSE